MYLKILLQNKYIYKIGSSAILIINLIKNILNIYDDNMYKLMEANMKLQVLVSCMHQQDYSLLEKMNIQTDAIIINQCDICLLYTSAYMGLKNILNLGVEYTYIMIFLLFMYSITYLLRCKNNVIDIAITFFSIFYVAISIDFIVPVSYTHLFIIRSRLDCFTSLWILAQL